jgi:outer membrane lipoprotein-sorting protein
MLVERRPERSLRERELSGVWVLFIAAALLASSPGSAQELTGNDIVERADQVMIGDSAEYESTMVVKRPDLQNQVFKYRTFFRERGERVLVRILAPPEQVGKDLLLIGNDMWQYIPDVERSVRIAGTQRFMGGDFNNGDLLNVSLVGDYDAELVSVVQVDGEELYYLELEAVGAGATYDLVKYWVRTGSFIPAREEYFTLSGKKMKTLIYSDVGDLGGRIRPRQLTMINALRPDHLTVVELTDAEFEKRIPRSYFTRTYLERRR